MTGQPWLVGQVVPEEFFRVFANLIFGDQKVVGKTFFYRQGVTQHPKIFSSECIKCFGCLCMYLYAGTMLRIYVMLGKLLNCKAQLLEINRAPTAG